MPPFSGEGYLELPFSPKRTELMNQVFIVILLRQPEALIRKVPRFSLLLPLELDQSLIEQGCCQPFEFTNFATYTLLLAVK